MASNNPLLDPSYTPSLESRIGLKAKAGDVPVPVIATGTCVWSEPAPLSSLRSDLVARYHRRWAWGDTSLWDYKPEGSSAAFFLLFVRS